MRFTLASSALLLSLLGVAGCAREELSNPPAPTATTAEPPSAPAGLVRIEGPSRICMVNDRYMDKEQIPVVVDGKTYYGCCAMCKEKLETNAAVRGAIDPVSGKPVDKASAIYARNEDGKVFYFASEDTLRKYAP